MSDLAYVNGIFQPIDQAKISIDDRGLQFGDSVYEVIKAFAGHPFLMSEHFARLKDGLNYLSIPIIHFWADLPTIVTDGLARTAHPESLVYIQITRGAQDRSLIYRKNLTPNIIITFRKFNEDHVRELRETGVKVCTRPDIRWGHCHIKTTNLLGNVLLRNEAADRDCYEAILYKPDFTVTEACSSSVFFVRNNTIFTAPLSTNILPGVNRNYVVSSVAPRLGISINETNSTINDLEHADEVFITSTSVALLPVVSIDNKCIADGKPGPIASALLDLMIEDCYKPKNISLP